MKKYLVLTKVCIVLTIINILWLVYNGYQYIDISKWFGQPEIYTILIFIGLLISFFSHILIVVTVLIKLKRTNSTFISGIFLLILGSVSFISHFFHWGCLTDILKEFPIGLEVNNELKVAWISLILHFSFMMYSLIFLIRSLNISKSGRVSESLFGEQLFISFNIIGIVCGFTGLLIVLIDFIFVVNPTSYKWAIVPYSVFVIIPYMIVFFSWFLNGIKSKKSGNFDEKQKIDIYKSATFSLVISIPLMLMLYLLNFDGIDRNVSILWLPFYIFVILLVFSLAALYNYKTN